jgi:heme-degrading monooxygenase HmoA
MAIAAMIKRKVKQGYQAKQLVPFILQLRALATFQPGYISGETLCNLEQPEEWLVISNWESIDHWKKWLNSKERAKIQEKIESLTGEITEYNIYEAMVVRSNS